MDPTKKSSDLFFATFLGEYVEILCKHEDMDKGKLVIHGYLLDMDRDFYFIGENPIEISAAVKREDVSFVTITQQVDPTVQLLEDMPVPEDEHESN